MSGSADISPSIRAAEDDRTFKLDQFKAGQIYLIGGGDGDFEFRVIGQDQAGPVGFLYNGDTDMMAVQIVGMLPFSHCRSNTTGLATLVPGIITADTGSVLAIKTMPDQALFEVFTFNCTSIKLTDDVS